jgi:hypothetical protein
VRQAEAFVREGSAFLRNPNNPGRITTNEVYAEDNRIIETVQAGKGVLQPIDLGRQWTIQSARVAGDKGQKNAVHHVLRSCDLLTGIAGKPGVGKTSTIAEAAAAIRSSTGQDPVMLAPTARTVGKLTEDGFAADTVANLRDKQAFQAAAAGRTIWCDEASALDNRDFGWLLHFVRKTGGRLVVSGDPKQHGAVQRGHPFKMLIDTGVLECAQLEKIYRQKDVPKLLEIIEHYHGERYEAALNQIEELGVVRESDTRSDALNALVMDAIAEFRVGQEPIIIAPVHRDGKDFACAIREQMKGAGMLGLEDQEIARLESCFTLDNGYKLDASKPLHIRQGYTMTSQASADYIVTAICSDFNRARRLVGKRKRQHVRNATNNDFGERRRTY